MYRPLLSILSHMYPNLRILSQMYPNLRSV
jgi:hypothetical protein